MKEEANTHHRRSLRLKDYNYSQEGMYFVTLVTYKRIGLFGDINDAQVLLNDYGQIVAREWKQTGILRPNIALDMMIIMPNHIHGIIAIVEQKGVLQYAPTKWKSPSQTIGAIIRGFKAATTSKINSLRKTPGQPVWQRNYYDHVIRNDKDLYNIRKYIIENPLSWDHDQENPANL
jgi:REP-associated tyrosine transposase